MVNLNTKIIGFTWSFLESAYAVIFFLCVLGSEAYIMRDDDDLLFYSMLAGIAHSVIILLFVYKQFFKIRQFVLEYVLESQT